MAFANEYRQFDPYAQPGFIRSASNPAEQGAYLAGAAQGAQAAYAADQQRLAAQAAWEAQQAAAQKAGQATNASLVALQEELAKNEAEITKLKEELSGLTAEYGDQDAVDRALAANRAAVGDMGTARAHQQDIQNRMQWRWQTNEAKTEADKTRLKKEAKDLVAQLEDAQIAMLMGGNAERPAWEAKIARIERELAENPYGAQYVAKAETPKAEDKKEYRSLDDVRKLVNKFRIENKDNKVVKGGMTDAQKDEVREAIKSLDPNLLNTVDVQNYLKSIEDEVSIDKQTARNNEQATKDKKKLDSFLKGKDYSDIEYLARTKKALPNGVSIEQSADGSLVVKVGKQQKKFAR